MSTALHSFIDIFETAFADGEDTIQLKKIEIPIIQRDYAQGRMDDDVRRVRKRFLASLYNALVDEPIKLDFVYGNIEDGIMTPLDGQQRLTTLFLLHWYAAKKEHISEEKYKFLRNFSYETRYSARDFCGELIGFTPSFDEKISKEIINQVWFPFDWKKDPTISSMLNMLDAIHEQFYDIPNIWDRLENNAITFYFLPIKDMGLTDELYIKMNSRGKPLTLFEHFKAELEREIKALDEKTGDSNAERIIGRIDRTWTDLLWNYRNGSSGDADDNTIDDEFLRYFKFICDVICYRNGMSPQNYSNDVFDLLHIYFSAQNEKTSDNLEMLEAFFDCWCNIDGKVTPTEFLASFMGNDHAPGKIMVDSKNKIDIFEDCIHAYSDKTGSHRQFPLNRIILLYAITIYLQHQTEITKDDFVRRIRIVDNLIQNSVDEISDRSDRNRLPAILQAVDAIILTGQIDDNIKNSFNVNQLNEEKEKITFIENHPELAEELFALEDHELLRGQVGIIGVDNLKFRSRFTSLFSCSMDKIDCALMSIGDYGQKEGNSYRYQYGAKNASAWTKLFHKSANHNFDETKAVLKKLLDTNSEFSNDILTGITDAFIAECEAKSTYPWRYYYVKYPVFRQSYYGKLYKETAAKPYVVSVMQTERHLSQNTYSPYLKEAETANASKARISRDHLGQRLDVGDSYITVDNDAFIIHSSDGAVLDTLPVIQSDDGIDIEDRIMKLKNYISSNY